MASASQPDGGPPRGQEEGPLQFIKALSTLDDWARAAAVGEARALEARDEGAQRAMRQAQDALVLLRNTISAGSPPEHVFALATTDEEEGGGILAIAAATYSDGRYDTRGGRMEIVVVARPTGVKQRVAVQELLDRVEKWAAARGRRVAVSQLREATEYRGGLAFEPQGTKLGPVEGSENQLVVFEPVDFEPYQPASSLVHEPYDVTRVVDAWAKEAAALSAKAVEDNDERAGRVMRGTLDILGRIRDGLAAGLPEYAFAVTDGGGAEGIRAIATVNSRNASAGAGGQKRKEVSIGELVAKPTAGGNDDGAAEAAVELVRLTMDWAVATGYSVAEFLCNMTHKGSAVGAEEEVGVYREIAEKLESTATPSLNTAADSLATAPSTVAQTTRSTTAATTAAPPSALEATTGATAAATTVATTAAAATATAAATIAAATTAAATTTAATAAAATTAAARTTAAPTTAAPSTVAATTAAATAAATTAALSTSRTAAWTAIFRGPTTSTLATATTTTTVVLGTKTKLAGWLPGPERTTSTTTMRDGVPQGTPHHVVAPPLAGRFHLITLRLPSPPGERLTVLPAAFASIHE